MSAEETASVTRWYVIHTNPRQEDRAEHNLRAWNVETFTPRIKERRFNMFNGAANFLAKPLFPRYFFARFDVTGMLSKVRFTRGVHSIVSLGGNPTPVDDSILETIQSRVGADGFVRMGEELKPGDEVLIEAGPLRNFTGIFERHMKESDRIMILLNTVSYQAHIVVPRGHLRKKHSESSS